MYGTESSLSVGTCSYQGLTYKHGQDWKPDVCRLCRCGNGQVSCYQESCTPCASVRLSIARELMNQGVGASVLVTLGRNQ